MRQYNLSLTPQVSFPTDCSADISRDKDGPCRKTEKVCCMYVFAQAHILLVLLVSQEIWSQI